MGSNKDVCFACSKGLLAYGLICTKQIKMVPVLDDCFKLIPLEFQIKIEGKVNNNKCA